MKNGKIVDVTPKKTSILYIVLKTVVSAVLIFLLFWFMLPAINIKSLSFWIFLFFCGLIILGVHYSANLISVLKNGIYVKEVFSKFHNEHGEKKKKFNTFMLIKIAISVVAVWFVLMIGLTVIGSPLFFASQYKELITFEDGDFARDVAEISMSQIPVVDKDSASRLGKRKLGEMSDLVSQFEIDPIYTQINYQGKPVRVTPLDYADPVKWLVNNQEGLPAYLMVDMVTQDTSLVRLEQGMKYSPNEYFMRRLDRYIRFKCPTKIFADPSFEIDENGTPYWVIPTIEYKIAFWSGRDIGGAVLVNAVTGELQYYDINEVPSWVDQVYDSDMIVSQLNYNGLYVQGYWNSIFGQKGVLQTTEGYNYIAIGDDVYLYTGMTSVVSDESNVGFVLVNMRTKETKYYNVPGAEEYSAMDSAMGQVQHLKYSATFPLLLNISDRPTYFMSLKDDAGLVKMYAFVDVQQYQIVGTGATIDEARDDYNSKLGTAEPETVITTETSVTGIVSAVSSVVVDGNTYYYLMLENDPSVYIASIKLNAKLPFIVAGNTVNITYGTDVDGIRTVTKLELAV